MELNFLTDMVTVFPLCCFFKIAPPFLQNLLKLLSYTSLSQKVFQSKPNQSKTLVLNIRKKGERMNTLPVLAK